MSDTDNSLTVQESLIAVMQSGHVSAETTVLAAEVIAAEARFDIRFGALKERAIKSDEEMFGILEASERLLYECREAAETFYESGNRKQLHADLVRLRSAFDNLAPDKKDGNFHE